MIEILSINETVRSRRIGRTGRRHDEGALSQGQFDPSFLSLQRCCARRPFRMGKMEADGDAVPHVDGAGRQRELNHLRLGEVPTQLLESGIRRACPRNQRERFGPGECSSLALAVERRILPGAEEIKALFKLTERQGFRRMCIYFGTVRNDDVPISQCVL
jgi:hypothetical protein